MSSARRRACMLTTGNWIMCRDRARLYRGCAAGAAARPPSQGAPCTTAPCVRRLPPLCPPPPQAIWLLLFLMLDRGDEYQLVNFVVGFKVCTPRATSLHPGRWSTSRPLPRPVCAWRGARSHGQDPSVRACGEHVEIYWHVKDARGRFSWSCVADTSREVSMRAQHNACAHEYFRVGAQRSAL